MGTIMLDESVTVYIVEEETAVRFPTVDALAAFCVSIMSREPRPMKILRKLTIEEYNALQAQFDRTPALYESAISGEHYQLTNLLNKLGYHPHTREETIKYTEELLTYGYPN